jgi:MFS family permease
MHPLTIIQISLASNALGGLLYLLALNWGLWALVLGRILLGFGSGILTVSRTVVGHGTSVQQRTK